MTSKAADSRSTLPQQSWPARSHATIFVRCLHLLDLDLLEDWPGVTEQLFHPKVAQQALQQRVKAVEWSLYRLFEIYDPDETKDKLRPFFPPRTQLQSINLRAALYRCLSELKKNGVLPKDALLRKTMLDDCKGERVEEILAGFAMATMRKTSESYTYAREQTLSNTQMTSMILAYRAALQGNIQARQEAGEDAREQLRQLESSGIRLQQRRKEVENSSLKIDKGKQEELTSLVNTNWVGNNDWTEMVLRGVPEKTLLEDVDHSAFASKSQDLIQDLDGRVQQHQTRLSEWKVIANNLKLQQDQEKVVENPPKNQAVEDRAISLRFSRHKSLNLTDWTPDGSTHRLDESYSNLIRAMEAELATQPRLKRKFATQVVSSMPLSIPTPNQEMTSTGSTPMKSQDAPLDFPEDGVRASSSEATPAAYTNSRKSSLIASSTQVSDSPSPLRSSDEDSPWIPKEDSNVATVKNGLIEQLKSGPGALDASVIPPSPSKAWMSLAERTQASMSLTGRQSTLTDPESPIDETEHVHAGATPDLNLSSDDDHHTTLLERTRRSMLQFSQSSTSRARKAKPEKRASQAFPISQFGTSSQSQRFLETPSASRASTPRDQLFDEDAEYSSVFKSRPKLALSPAFSPQRRTPGLDGTLEMEMDRLDLDPSDIE